ncbi:MAG: hypothetical protein FWE31_01570 [Firmicutes bacterium]|nr:hypothetical protein [Bacillota bacterium]
MGKLTIDSVRDRINSRKEDSYRVDLEKRVYNIGKGIESSLSFEEGFRKRLPLAAIEERAGVSCPVYKTSVLENDIEEQQEHQRDHANRQWEVQDDMDTFDYGTEVRMDFGGWLNQERLRVGHTASEEIDYINGLIWEYVEKSADLNAAIEDGTDERVFNLMQNHEVITELEKLKAEKLEEMGF